MTGRGPSPPDRPVWTIAHRGASRDRPENTLAAFDEALAQGADGIELDVQLSRDGVPMVYHDRTLARAGGGRRRVSQLDAREIEALDAGVGFDGHSPRQRIPALEQVLERYGRRTRLLVEIKTREGPPRDLELARTVARMIDRMGLGAETLILCFDARVLAACVEEAPRVRPALNLKPPPLMTPAIRKRLAALHALSADVRTLTIRFGASVRRAGTPLYVYTCNTPRAVRRALAAGASGVMSDRPRWLARQLARAAGKHEA